MSTSVSTLPSTDAVAVTFAELGIPDDLVGTLHARGLESAFPIQAMTVPDGLAGRDLCGRAPTGSGKTVAFGIPLAVRVAKARPRRPRGLVLVPTRELAAQVCGELEWLGRSRKLRVAAVYGGAGFGAQLKALRRGVDVLVACPGRLTDLLERRELELDEVEMVVVDEADRMADMGFLPDVRALLDRTPERRQTLLFSATLDGAVDELVRRYQREPSRHQLPETDQLAATHHFWATDRNSRIALTADIVTAAGPTIVFCRTKHGADALAKKLEQRGVRCAAIHGNRSQGQRERALSAFASGKVQALVATDVAARGIHVDAVACVVHFDPPHDFKDYTHRSGRTARAGADGIVVSLVLPEQRRAVGTFQRELGQRPGLDRPAVGDLGRRPAPVAEIHPAPPVDIDADGRPRGTIKWFDARKGFGFIERRGERDVFVHFSAIEGDGYRRLEEGQVVEFDLAPGRQGDQARRVRVLAAA
jgi:superfamily II DNA/RNA helicase/cold shock CspA family protein